MYAPLTQAFVAKELGISQSFLSKLEKGQQGAQFPAGRAGGQILWSEAVGVCHLLA
jgi:transcriptional regulator with XRE-family HTH domain